MIIDHIRNAGRYIALGEPFAATLDYLAKTDFSAWEDGRRKDILPGGRAFVTVQRYETLPGDKCSLEYHEHMADIQFIALGRESIGYADRAACADRGDFSAEKDIGFLDGARIELPMGAGYFMVLFPQDAHAPKIAVDISEPVVKALVKIRL